MDDEASLRDVLGKILSAEGYEVRNAGNGREALDLLAAERFDFLLCDLRMPVMGGLELLREITSRGIPGTVIMMSAFGTVETAVEAMKLGAYDYVSKPFVSDEILLTLRKAAERERLREENASLRREIERAGRDEEILYAGRPMEDVVRTAIILAANSDDSDKMKIIKKTAKTIYLKPVPPRLLGLYLGKVLKEEGAKLSLGTTIKVMVECRGDIRSMLNMAQAQLGGFDVDSEKSFETLDIEAGINAFFKAKTRQEAQSVLYSLRIDPREKLNAFYSSIVTSNIPNKDMARLLDVISEADVLYGRIIRTQEWRLLRYLDNILLRLYSENLPIQYCQYNLSWPLLYKLRWDGCGSSGR